jgi:hypothetical protein
MGRKQAALALLLFLLLAVAVIGVLSGPAGYAAGARARAGTLLFSDRFSRPNGANGLITNEYAERNPADALAVRSQNWQVTSGSFFVKRGVGWTGAPDGCKPDRYSQSCNDSAVFRLHTRRVTFGDVAVSLRLLNHSLTSTARTPARAIDGVHLWLHYQSETELYAVSVNRRDASIVIKKKCPGGPSNGGTYYDLAKPLSNQPIPFGVWQKLTASIRANADGSVTISLSRNGAPLTSVTDHGVGCSPIAAAGAVGVRGDNDNFSIDNFTVTGKLP